MHSLTINSEQHTLSTDARQAPHGPWVSGSWRQDLEIIIAELRTRKQGEALSAEETLHRLELSSFRNWGINE